MTVRFQKRSWDKSCGFKALATATTRNVLINIARDAREKIETKRKKEVAEKRSQADMCLSSPKQR